MSGIIGVSPDMRSGVVGKFPLGHVIQTKMDTYERSGAMSVTTSAYILLNGNLEVTIKFTKTSNFFRASVFIPGSYNNSTSTAATHCGLAYSNDNWSSDNILGDRKYLSPYNDYLNLHNALLGNISYETNGQVPTTDEIKIIPSTTAVNATTVIFDNSGSTRCVGSIIIQEIQA